MQHGADTTPYPGPMTRPHLWIRAEARPTEQRVPIVPEDAEGSAVVRTHVHVFPRPTD